MKGASTRSAGLLALDRRVSRCPGCGAWELDDVCTTPACVGREILRFTPTPAAPETGNLAVSA